MIPEAVSNLMCDPAKIATWYQKSLAEELTVIDAYAMLPVLIDAQKFGLLLTMLLAETMYKLAVANGEDEQAEALKAQLTQLKEAMERGMG